MFEMVRSRLRVWIGDATLQRLVKNASMLIGAQTIVMFIGMAQYPLVTRMLGPENYGVWSITISWVGLVSQILSFRLWETVIKYLNQFMGVGDESRALAVLKLVLLIDFSVGVLTFLIVNLSADVAARFVLQSRPDGADLIRLEAFNAFMGLSMSVWMAVLRVFDRFRLISIYNVLSSVALFIFWMAVLAAGAGLPGLILASAVVKLGQTIALGALARRELRRRFRGSWFSADLSGLKDHRREIWVMLFSMNLDTFRKMVTESADILILGWFTAPVQVGLYKLGKQLAFYLNRVFGQFYEVMYPEIPRLYASEGPARVRSFIRRVTFGLGATVLVSVIAACLFAPPLIPIVFGPDYVGAIPLFLVLLVSNFWVLLFWAPSLMVTLGKAPQLVLINFAISAATLIALLVFTPLWSAYGAAFASAVNLIAGLLIYMWYFNRVPGFRWEQMFLKKAKA